MALVLAPFGIGLLVMWQTTVNIQKEKRSSGWKLGNHAVLVANQPDSRMVVLVGSALLPAGKIRKKKGNGAAEQRASKGTE